MTRDLALVTGAASGIGAACVERLVTDGFEVLGLDVGPARPGSGARHRELDVTDEAGWVTLAEERTAGPAPVTVLVTSAGVLRFGSVESCTVEDFRLLLDVNVTGTFLALKQVLPLMRAQGRGSAITISSVAGLILKPNQLAYVASKWAVRGLAKAAAQDLGGSGGHVLQG